MEVREIESNLISEYMQLLNKMYEDALCLSSEWWILHKDDCKKIGRTFNHAKKMKSKEKQKQLVRYFKVLIFPIHTTLDRGGGHWYLIAVYPANR